MNKIILIGRLTQAPEIRYTQAGKAICKFSLAVDCRRKNSTPDYINCVAWEKLGEVCGNYLDKGRKVAVEGRISMRSYQTSQGAKRTAAEVVCSEVLFLDSPHRGKTDWPSQFGREVPQNEELPF